MYSCGNACVAFSGDGNIQEKICVNTRRKPCERCEKSADHEHGTFLSLKHWKGYYSKNRRSFFSDSLKHQNCIAIVVKRNFLLKSWAGNESAGMYMHMWIMSAMVHLYWLSNDLIVCVRLTMFTNQIPMRLCVCGWVKYNWLLQITFSAHFSSAEMFFMHV